MITKKQFIEWLESKKPLARVGKPASSTQCVFCNYLKESRKDPSPLFLGRKVHGYKYFEGFGFRKSLFWFEIYSAPFCNEWQNNFQRKASSWVNDDNTKQITAKTCLKIMRGL
ncbi:hypothetical protein GWO43_30325 [candidate division KSB1 bacterium]|nr:hypothetical protein [candidate division KSB1 bacterium]NIT75079.1 hypothetical protein [candidate division KSB1 bacterium]NIX74759.1 hypothetical protein [candidate division KSB1 bacterium]